MPRLTALSGFGAKGPACFLLELAGRRLLLDLGEGPDRGARPDLSNLGPVDAVLISHGHPDHTGALDLLADLGGPAVYATGPVWALVPRLAEASALPRRGRFEARGVPVEVGAAGHAPGAVWLCIGGEEGLLYTGDTSAESRLFACDPLPRAKALVFDASYGAAQEALDTQAGALLAMAAEGPLLLPAPAAGRGLELALAALAAGHPVAICPAHRAAAELLAALPEWLVPGGAPALSRLLDAAGALGPASRASGVMVAAGPNADSGVAAELAPAFAATGAARVVFTGHLASRSPAEALVKAGTAIVRRWNVHPRLQEVRAILGAVRPGVAMPAFVGEDGRAALAAALGPVPLADRGEIVW